MTPFGAGNSSSNVQRVPFDDARAEAILRRYIGPRADALTPRLLTFDAGWRPVQWKRNCVAIGLAAGFLEPLESTGIGLIEIATYLVAHLLPPDGERAGCRVARSALEHLSAAADAGSAPRPRR